LKSKFFLLFYALVVVTLVGWHQPVYASADFSKHIILNKEGLNPIGYLQIKKDQSINDSTYLYIKFALEDFAYNQVKFVLLDMDTPGGEVVAASKISKLLVDFDAQNNSPVVCYIDNWALSAGALIAYSCRYIVIKSNSLMGAAEPVTRQANQMQTASEKIISALRSEFHNAASLYGRNPYIAEAMVDKGLIVVDRDNKIINLSDAKDIRKKDVILSPQGKLLTLDADQMQHFGIADLLVTSHIDQTAEVRWENPSLQQFFNSGFFSQIEQPELIKYKDWKIGFFTVLSHPFVMSLLFVLVVVSFYIELSTPGFGFAGSLGIVCLALILLSSFSIYTIHWIEPTILLVGILLLLIEIFVIPGFGIVGILGIIFFVTGLFLLMLPSFSAWSVSINTGVHNIFTYDLLYRLTWLLAAFIISFILIFLLAKYLMPNLHLFRKFILKEPQKAKGYDHLKTHVQPTLLGTEAVVVAVLKPYGKIVIDGQVYDAYAEMGFIDKGKKVIIIKVEKNKLIVRQID